jgi:hypothetical protein
MSAQSAEEAVESGEQVIVNDNEMALLPQVIQLLDTLNQNN